MTTDAGTNWTSLEDVALCTSWVEVTHSSRMANRLLFGEAPWHKLVVMFEVGKLHRSANSSTSLVWCQNQNQK
ncbi:hypothetical protein FF1_032904 [Malus domestica]